jgi:hypothetical protein
MISPKDKGNKGGAMVTDKRKKTFDNVPSESIRRFPRMQRLDYSAVLADLEAKRADLDRAITSLRRIVELGVIVGTAEGAPPLLNDSASAGLHGGEVPVGAFLGKSIPEAAKLCLQIVKRKLTSREVSDYLKKGGIETTAHNFPSLVHSILTRASSKSPAEILKLDRSHWGLAEWYPAGLRGAAAARSVNVKKGRRNRPEKSSQPKGKGTQTQLVEFLRRKPGAEFAPKDIATSLGMRIQTVHFLLGKLAFRGEAEKTTDGKYKAVAA